MKKTICSRDPWPALPCLALAATPPPPPPLRAPAPKIVVVDRTAFMQSKAGQDIVNQVKAYADQAEADLDAAPRCRPKASSCSSRSRSCRRTPRPRKIEDFEDRQAALQAHASPEKQHDPGRLYQAAARRWRPSARPILQRIIQAARRQSGAGQGLRWCSPATAASTLPPMRSTC